MLDTKPFELSKRKYSFFFFTKDGFPNAAWWVVLRNYTIGRLGRS